MDEEDRQNESIDEQSKKPYLTIIVYSQREDDETDVPDQETEKELDK